jgi:hypothetical protein
MKMSSWRWIGACVAVAALAAGCAGGAAGLTPATATTTAMQGWEKYFRLDWTAQAKPSGREIDGYIYNTYGSPAANVQVLAQGLDEAGTVVGQKLEWVPGIVPALNRSYFRVAGLPPANAYRVSVWAFDFVQGNDQRR